MNTKYAGLFFWLLSTILFCTHYISSAIMSKNSEILLRYLLYQNNTGIYYLIVIFAVIGVVLFFPDFFNYKYKNKK